MTARSPVALLHFMVTRGAEMASDQCRHGSSSMRPGSECWETPQNFPLTCHDPKRPTFLTHTRAPRVIGEMSDPRRNMCRMKTPKSNCRCHMCDEEPGNLGLDGYMAIISDHVGRVGWAVQAVPSDDEGPAWAYRLAVRPVHQSWRMTSMFTISDCFYGYVRPLYLQIAWPDRKGRFPWEPGFDAEFDDDQPMLWLPRDDHPPGAWTRLDHLPR